MESEKRQYVVFRIGTEEYGADINKVTVIERMMNITRVPMTPPYIKGVINLRGEIIPVMDLRNRFGLPEKDADEDTRIIMIDIHKVNFGIIVDSVSEVIQLEETQIEGVTGIIGDKSSEYIDSVAKTGELRLVTLVQLEKLVSELITLQ